MPLCLQTAASHVGRHRNPFSATAEQLQYDRDLLALFDVPFDERRLSSGTNISHTELFELTSQGSISPPDGVLILPKLFRRCTDYLKARAEGFSGTLPDWLVSVSASGSRPEDDRVLIGGRTEVPLSQIVKQLNDRISFTADLLDVVFVEK